MAKGCRGQRRAKRARAGSSALLPAELWEACVRFLTPSERRSAALACKDLAAASLATCSRLALPVSEGFRRCLPRHLPSQLREVFLVSDAQFVSELPVEEEAALTDYDATRPRKVASCRHALMGLVNALPEPRPSAVAAKLSLTLAITSMEFSLRQLDKVLVSINSRQLFSEVQVVRGAAALDGALQDKLTRAVSLGTGLGSSLQANAYHRLASLTVKLHSSQELAALLPCLSPRALPALHTLVLAAKHGVHAPLSELQHGGLRRLALHGVEVEDGFEGLEQLEGLESLSMCYEEDEGPEVNLEGSLHALSSLQKLRHLRLTSLACDEGLSSLTQLSSLALTPGSDTYLAVEHLPGLQRLTVDLTAECRGLELLQRGCVVYIPKAHGLASLTSVELRSLEWHPVRAPGGSGWLSGSGSGSDSAGPAVLSAGSNAWEGLAVAAGAGADQGVAAAGWDSESEDGSGSEQGWELEGDGAGAGVQWALAAGGGGEDGEFGGEESEGEEEGPGDAGSMGSNSDVEDDDALSEEALSEEAMSDDVSEVAGSDATESEGSEGEEEAADGGEDDIAAAELAAWTDGDGGLLGEGAAAAGEEEKEVGAGYAVAAPQHAQQGSGEDGAKALALLESRYLGGLVRRVPTLTSITLSDFLGPLPTALTRSSGPQAADEEEHAGSGGGSGRSSPPRTRATTARAAAAAAVGAAGTGEAVVVDAAGRRVHATLCCIGGTVWQRSVSEMPVPGGISQYDLRYTKL